MFDCLYSGDTLRRQSMGLFSLNGQLCSLTLEAIQSFGLASSGKHSGKHNSPGGEGLAGYRHSRRAASAPASRTAAMSLSTPFIQNGPNDQKFLSTIA